MELYSEYLQRNIDFPEDKSMSPHEVLEKILVFETDAKYDYKPFICDSGSISVKCSIWDEKGRSAIGCGEANRNNLSGDISQNYPVKMAIKRAFDDAAINYFQLPRKDFKMLFGMEDDEPDQLPNQSNQENTCIEEKRESVQATPQVKTSKPAEEKPESYEKTIITIGRQRGKNYTVEQLAEKDLDSLMYVAYTYPQQVNPTAPERQAQVNACRRWLDEHGYQPPEEAVA